MNEIFILSPYSRVPNTPKFICLFLFQFGWFERWYGKKATSKFSATYAPPKSGSHLPLAHDTDICKPRMQARHWELVVSNME